jgi:hexosaminidase
MITPLLSLLLHLSACGIIPAPASYIPAEGTFTLTLSDLRHAAIVYTADEARAEAQLCADYLRLTYGLTLPVTDNVRKRYRKSIRFTTDYDGANPEGYRLTVSPTRIELHGSPGASAAGRFYALQSLIQLCAAASTRDAGVATIPCATIADEPRYPYRGIMQDVGYHIYPVAFIKKEIDLLAQYKMNVYHWHLTEDHGWRIEIKQYPRLTSVAAWRAQTVVSNYDRSLEGMDGTPYGGFYTQDEIRDIVRYAEARHVTVIPEIELPGHTLAVLAAYPELACGDNPGPFKVAETWGIYEDVFCAGKEETFTFLENVLTEVMELFPSPYIHIGGDECPKARWKACPYCQRRIRDNRLKDEFELQSYFVKRIARFVEAKGRRIIGWDEILEGGLAPGATVMNWRDISEGVKAAQQGHDVIMAPNGHLYFDYLQGERPQEPLAIGWGFNPTEHVYAYEPTPPELTPAQRKHIIGVEAPLWTEHMDTHRKVEYMLLPRLMALAEIGWTPAARKDLRDFTQERLPLHLARLDSTDTVYRVPEPIGIRNETLQGGDFTFTLRPSVAGARIYYNFDGQEPRETDYLYTQPIRVIVPPGEKREIRTIVVTPSGKRSNSVTTVMSNEQ